LQQLVKTRSCPLHPEGRVFNTRACKVGTTPFLLCRLSGGIWKAFFFRERIQRSKKTATRSKRFIASAGELTFDMKDAILAGDLEISKGGQRVNGEHSATDTLWPKLRERLRMWPPSSSSVVDSLPILFFGDALSAQVCTVGLNPSMFEYLDKDGQILTGQAQRFYSLTGLGAKSRGDLTDPQADVAIETMRDYFNLGKPVYGSYFRHLSNFVRGMGVSYIEKTATHLDLVQESTDPVWNDLDRDIQSELLKRDLPFLSWELENLPQLRAVVCTGATVSDYVRGLLEVKEVDSGTIERIRWWCGTAKIVNRALKIGGWNYPLDRPTGLGNNGEVKLGQMFAGKLL
jgi:uracil-DNA glycosylase